MSISHDVTIYHETSCEDNPFQHSCQRSETSAEAKMEFHRDRGSYKYVISWFVFVVPRVDTAMSNYNFPHSIEFVAGPLK
jgi:hypothetical protein